MSLLNSFKTKAIEHVNDKDRQKKWVETGFDAAVSEAGKLIPTGDLDPGLQYVADLAKVGLDRLVENKETLVGLGENGLRTALVFVGIGDYDSAAKHAALLTLRQSGSWDDVTNAIVTTAESGNEKKRKLDKAYEEIKAVLKSIGYAAAKAILPLLIAA